MLDLLGRGPGAEEYMTRHVVCGGEGVSIEGGLQGMLDLLGWGQGAEEYMTRHVVCECEVFLVGLGLGVAC